MIRVLWLVVTLILGCATDFVGAKGNAVALNPVSPKVAKQCGMTMQVPRLNNVFDQSLEFECEGSYKNGGYANLAVDFQYDPNRNAGGERIDFNVQGVGISEKMIPGKGGAFVANGNENLPKLGGARRLVVQIADP